MPSTNREPARSPEAPEAGEIGVIRPWSARTDFYRAELRRHLYCLDQQREHYSCKAMTDVEAAILRLMHQVDRLCADERGDRIVTRLLQTIDGVTRLSAASDQQPTH